MLAPSAPAYADDAVECVQLMLSSFDIDPGPIDGFYGNRTRVASLAFSRLTGTAWEPLNPANAETWCTALKGFAASVAGQAMYLASNREQAAGVIRALMACGPRDDAC